MPLDEGGVEAAGPGGELGDVDAPDRDGLAVADGVVAGALDRVGEGVAVVEHLATGVAVRAAGLLEVVDDDVDLHPDRPLDELAQLGGVPGQVRRVGALDDVEDGGVGDEAALHDLAQPGDELLVRQRLQQRQVAQHAGGLVEGPDEVLAGAGVDAGLAADRGVDHGQQGGGHVDDADAAQPRRGDEPAEVGGRSPADRHDRVGPGEAGLAERLPAVGRDRRGLGPLAVGESEREDVVVLHQGVDHRVGQLAQRAGVEHRDPLDRLAQQRGQPLGQPVADDDVVGGGTADVQHGVAGLLPDRRVGLLGPPLGRRCWVRCWVRCCCFLVWRFVIRAASGPRPPPRRRCGRRCRRCGRTRTRRRGCARRAAP